MHTDKLEFWPINYIKLPQSNKNVKLLTMNLHLQQLSNQVRSFQRPF